MVKIYPLFQTKQQSMPYFRTKWSNIPFFSTPTLRLVIRRSSLSPFWSFLPYFVSIKVMIFSTWETRWDIEGWKNNDKSGLKMKQQEGKLHKILWSLTLSCNSVILEGIVHKNSLLECLRCHVHQKLVFCFTINCFQTKSH